jgi:acyl-CoA dehydrogenase
MFFVDMRSPGVEVRPIRQMTGDSEFNEVFFTDVRISDAQRLSEVGGGWRAALTTLMFERLSVGVEIGLISLNAFIEVLRSLERNGAPVFDDPRTRERIADWYVESAGLRLFSYRSLTALSRGQVPGPEQSIVKLVSARQGQAMANFAFDLAGPSGIIGAGEGPAWRAIEHSWMWAAAMRIAGGTDEILRNIIAERVLGMPAEPRVDKEQPFAGNSQ